MKMDVGIVGAGPSGAWAAYCLARRGARVVLFDPSHPREKPCGGGVTGRALALVSDAVPSAALSAAVIRRVVFTDSGRPVAAVALDGRPEDPSAALVVASRTVFDGALLTAALDAGATLVRARVADVTVQADGVSVATTAGAFRAPFLIGADGANSLVRRRVTRPFGRDELSVATGFFARGVTSEEIVIEMVADPPGYIWSFPRPDHLAVGICTQADAGVSMDDLRKHTTRWIAESQIAGCARLDAYSWPIPSLGADSLNRLTLAGPRWCLVGDAAGLVDSITREGIYFALLSGERAAEALAGDARPSAYAACIRSEIVPELAIAARLKAGFFRPSFTSLLIRALIESPRIREVTADLLAGRQSYRGLKRRLLGTLEWTLAWRLLLSARNTRRAHGREAPSDRR